MFALALYRKPQESHIVTVPTSINDLLFHFTVPQNLLYPAENIKCLKSHLGPCNFKHETCQDVILTHIKKLKRIKFIAALRELGVKLWFGVLLLLKSTTISIPLCSSSQLFCCLEPKYQCKVGVLLQAGRTSVPLPQQRLSQFSSAPHS